MGSDDLFQEMGESQVNEIVTWISDAFEISLGINQIWMNTRTKEADSSKYRGWRK
jgi:hypothetical protein